METEKEPFNLQLLLNDVYVNYERLTKHLYRLSPAACTEFNSFEATHLELPYRYFEYFRAYQFMFWYKETNALKANYAGTFSYRIIVTKQIAFELGRKKRDFTYYGINTKQKAIEKMIEKGFEIVECLLTDKELPEKLRRSF